MNEQRLVQLRKRAGEEDDEFMERFDLTIDDLKKWKELTHDGQLYGGDALAA